jgi:pimeloyl-ACP methyl ester carboxylesterase
MERITIEGIPAILYGEPAKKIFVFIHGKNGSKEEAKAFSVLAGPRGFQVLSFDLPEHGERKDEGVPLYPWNAVPEFRRILSYTRKRWEHISVRANSIGAYLAMLSFAEERIDGCLFVSPILDMERLIGNLMNWSGVTEEQLKAKKTIPTAFGETLSWMYLCYVREHQILKWNIPTSILYGSADNLTERETVDVFTARHGCALTVVDGGEHWFHTAEQLSTMDRWTETSLQLMAE